MYIDFCRALIQFVWETGSFTWSTRIQKRWQRKRKTHNFSLVVRVGTASFYNNALDTFQDNIAVKENHTIPDLPHVLLGLTMSDMLEDCVVLLRMITCNLPQQNTQNIQFSKKDLQEATETLPWQNSENVDLALGFSLLSNSMTNFFINPSLAAWCCGAGGNH